jgi:hypothetical protein
MGKHALTRQQLEYLCLSSVRPQEKTVEDIELGPVNNDGRNACWVLTGIAPVQSQQTYWRVLELLKTFQSMFDMDIHENR